MADILEILGYIKKLRKTVSAPEFSAFGYSLVKKNRVDDLFCCVLATLPDIFKATMKKRIPLTTFPSVSAFNRLTKVMKKTFFLSKDLYIFKANDVLTLLLTIEKNLERDIKKLETN